MLERNIKHFIFFYLSTSNLRCSMFCLNVHFNRHFHTVVDKNTRFGIMSRFYSKTHFLDQTKYMFLVSTSVSLSFRMISQKFPKHCWISRFHLLFKAVQWVHRISWRCSFSYFIQSSEFRLFRQLFHYFRNSVMTSYESLSIANSYLHLCEAVKYNNIWMIWFSLHSIAKKIIFDWI